VAEWAIVPLQDVLGLGGEARMNTPGQATGNWLWRATAGQLRGEEAGRLRRLAEVSGRLPRPAPGP
jgi:4-alpha-glucanotransferase